MDVTSPTEGNKVPSRYRSVRQQQNSSPAPPEPESGVHRSRSRYHRRPETAHGNDTTSPVTQTRSAEARYVQADAFAGAQDDDLPESPMESLTERPERIRSNHEQRPVSQRRRTDSPRAQIDPRRPSNRVEVKFDQAPQVIHARKERELGPQDEVISDDDAGGCFSGLFKKKRFDPIKNVSEKPALARKSASRKKEASNIQAGGRGNAPGNDAPVSASNAGDRRVLVEYKKTSIQLPVTQETTVMDLISSAANLFSDPIDVKAYILLEHFGTVGVQRPLRRFERVKDVMNSWDDDKANSLLLVPARATDVNPSGLSASNVPGNRLLETSFLMHYSQKPGHWEKRLITIREDGQIVMSKPKDTEATTNICRLSDFDIYTPTATAMSKKVKPPKKFCYAIKSQEKTSMFMQQSQYVHFFSASDKTLATSFHDAVQGWRSWYLVHVMGEGAKTPKIGSTGGVQRSPSKATKSPSHAHQNTESSIGSQYQIGSFKPIGLDMSQFDRPSSSGSQHTRVQQQPTAMNQVPTRGLSTRDRNHPPSAFPRTMLGDNEPLVNLAGVRRQSLEVKDDDDAFKASGLLGRSYSTRRREAEREEIHSGPFTGGGLMGNTTTTIEGGLGVNRQSSVKRSNSRRNPAANTGLSNRPSNTNLSNRVPGNNLSHRRSTREGANSGIRRNGSIDLGHTGSTRRPGGHKPLVDLTPTYQPPPQHVKKGGAYRPSPDELRSGALIDAATSGEKSWRDEIPETRDWRGRAGAGGRGENIEPSRNRSRSRGENIVPQHSDSNHSGGRVRAAPQGPLLDISDSNNFAKGSLLDKVQREQPRTGPVIDREG